MRIMFGTFLFAFCVSITQKCVAVILAKFGLACMHARPLKYLHMLVYIEHVHHAHAHALHRLTEVSLQNSHNQWKCGCNKVIPAVLLRWMCQSKEQQKYTLSKDSKDSTIKQGLIEQNTRCGLKAVKAVEVLPLVTP